ncbi:MAG: hypothetical protein IT378_12050 [Sandaracinaceae bacterium]|nr:hypothetical protein [Sandaracinaceae bacterium]
MSWRALVAMAVVQLPFALVNALDVFPQASTVWASLAWEAVGVILADAMIVSMTVDLVAGRRPDLLGAAWLAIKRWPFLLVTSVLVSVALTAGYLCFILPGLVLTASLVIALPIVVMEEDVDPIRALRRSHARVAGYRWPILGATLTAGVVAFLGNAFVARSLPLLWAAPFWAELDPSVSRGLAVAVSTLVGCTLVLVPSIPARVLPAVVYVMRMSDPQEKDESEEVLQIDRAEGGEAVVVAAAREPEE